MDPEMRPCLVCGEVFYMFPGEVCSQECNSRRCVNAEAGRI